jgi:hypothetical protein
VLLVAATQRLRTIYLPNEHSDLLVLSMESMALQLEDQEGMCDQKARLMLELRHTRALEHKKRQVAVKDSIKLLKKNVRVLRKKVMDRQQQVLVMRQGLQR